MKKTLKKKRLRTVRSKTVSRGGVSAKRAGTARHRNRKTAPKRAKVTRAAVRPAASLETNVYAQVTAFAVMIIVIAAILFIAIKQLDTGVMKDPGSMPQFVPSISPPSLPPPSY